MTEETHFRGNVTQKAVTFGPAGDVLLVQHPEGKWVIPGGRVNAGESAEAALIREMREETSLTVTVERPVLTGTDLWTNDDGEPMFTVVYRCEAEERAVTLNDEHDDYVWLPPKQAAQRVRGEPLAVAIERAWGGRR
ncbi:NUDIX domain-containing protein [Halomarina salina]|uniref:NUDIX domain-containing protein n=1 Tax=Halomarina salina TaxID=1872699 RepID=A0ABD5RKS4_9EURY